MTEAATQYSGMSRAEFIKQMGLTDADIASPSSSKGTSPMAVAKKDAVLATAMAAEGGDAAPAAASSNTIGADALALMEKDKVIEDDTWVRNTVFLDPSVIAAEQDSSNELRQTLLEEYRVRATAANQRAIAGEEEVAPRDVLAEVTPERRREAADYKAQLLQQYLNRKANAAEKKE